MIARGQETLAPLIRATEDAVRSDDTIVLRASLLCLARIGGPEAEHCLAGIVRQIGSVGTDWETWHRHAFAAYAECAGPRSVPELIRAYDRTHEDEKWCVLAALAKTCTREAVSFVFQHIEDLFKGANSGIGDDARTACLTLQVLLSKPVVDDLRKLPLHRYIFGSVDPGLDAEGTKYQREFFWTSPADRDVLETNELSVIWKQNGTAFQDEWLEALSKVHQ